MKSRKEINKDYYLKKRESERSDPLTSKLYCTHCGLKLRSNTKKQTIVHRKCASEYLLSLMSKPPLKSE